MNIKLTKLHFIVSGIAFFLIAALGLFLYFGAENSVNQKLDDLSRQLSIAKANKACQENALSDAECKELIARLTSNFNIARLELMAGINNECKVKNFTENQCEQYKKINNKKLEDEIQTIAPFSELSPEVRAKTEEMGTLVCKSQSLSEEDCRKTKLALMKMVQEKRESILKTVRKRCLEAGLSMTDNQCQEMEIKELKEFNTEIINRASGIK